MDIQRLRQETEADHQSAEAALPLMRASLSKAQYVHYLCKLYEVVATWEEVSSEVSSSVAPDWLCKLLVPRRRTAFLLRDLAWFGIPEPVGRATLAPMCDFPSLLGAMYVMEGSTLGGQIIARHVARVLPLPDGDGDAFFRGHGPQTGPLWKEFCEVLKTRIPEEDAGSVILSAKAMFASFTDSMQKKSVLNGS